MEIWERRRSGCLLPRFSEAGPPELVATDYPRSRSLRQRTARQQATARRLALHAGPNGGCWAVLSAPRMVYQDPMTASSSMSCSRRRTPRALPPQVRRHGHETVGSEPGLRFAYGLSARGLFQGRAPGLLSPTHLVAAFRYAAR